MGADLSLSLYLSPLTTRMALSENSETKFNRRTSSHFETSQVHFSCSNVMNSRLTHTRKGAKVWSCFAAAHMHGRGKLLTRRTFSVCAHLNQCRTAALVLPNNAFFSVRWKFQAYACKAMHSNWSLSKSLIAYLHLSAHCI
jgi:hypothetical protein